MTALPRSVAVGGQVKELKPTKKKNGVKFECSHR